MEGSTLHGDSLSPSFPLPSSNAAGSSSSLPSPLVPQEPGHERRERSVTYRVNISVSNPASSADVGDEVWSCAVVLVSFWFFASMTLILGFYGSVDFHLGANCSRLIHANSLFVQAIQVRVMSEPKAGPMLYDFSRPPSLDVKTNRSECHNATVPPNLHKEWIYYLNKGSQVNVSYVVKSTSSSPLSLVIAEGNENLIEWLEDPSYPDTTLSWNLIHGNGLIQQKILKSSNYYIAVGNLNSQEAEVQLNLSIQAVVYNTTKAYNKCALDKSFCLLKLHIFRSNVAVLTSPGTVEGAGIRVIIEKDHQLRLREVRKKHLSVCDFFCKQLHHHIELLQRRKTGSSLTLRRVILMLGSLKYLMYQDGSHILLAEILVKCQRSPGDGSEYQERMQTTERTPLLGQKEDDASSLGSSYDSVSHDEEEFEDLPGAGSVETKSIKGEPNYPQRLCAICFTAPRDCFFLPCGHCATCFTCGTRIAEEAGICPICRRKLKKVRKIFTV